jgi:nucleotidyltransferase/DNA polymerase involved in DNA repair
MSRSANSRSGQHLELFDAIVDSAQKPVSPPQSKPSQSVAALWLADPPTWALGRLHYDLPPDVPVVAASGTRVVGSNTPARKCGIKPNESLSRAVQLCPNLVIYEHDPAAMNAAWDSAVATAYSFSPWVEPVQTGLLFVGGLNASEAELLAHQTSARVGLAQSRGTAQLAALTASENHARAVRSETEFLAQVPTRYLLGMGLDPKIVERLQLFGIDHLADIHRLNLTQKQLEAQFKAEGKRLYQIAHGLLTAPVQRFKEPLLINERWEFETPAVEPFEFLPCLQLLTFNAAAELANKVCWTVTITLKYKTQQRLKRRVMGAPTNKPQALTNVAELTLWDAHLGGEAIAALELSLGRIVAPTAWQQSLFGVFERPTVQDAIERVDGRFNGGIGRMSLRCGSRFREESWRFIPLGPSQQAQVGDGRRLR